MCSRSGYGGLILSLRSHPDDDSDDFRVLSLCQCHPQGVDAALPGADSCTEGGAGSGPFRPGANGGDAPDRSGMGGKQRLCPLRPGSWRLAAERAKGTDDRMTSWRLALSLLWAIVTLVWIFPVPCAWLWRAIRDPRQGPHFCERYARWLIIKRFLFICSGISLGVGVIWREYYLRFIIITLVVHLLFLVCWSGFYKDFDKRRREKA